MAKAIPEGYHSLTPSFTFKDSQKAIDFYKKAFGAKVLDVFPSLTGRGIMHATLQIGDSIIMLADEHPEIGARSPRAFGGSGVGIMLYVDDVDATVKAAVAGGAKVVQPVEDKFYGDRTGTIEDPFGHTWHVGTHKEDVPEDEMKRRMASMAKAG